MAVKWHIVVQILFLLGSEQKWQKVWKHYLGLPTLFKESTGVARTCERKLFRGQSHTFDWKSVARYKRPLAASVAATKKLLDVAFQWLFFAVAGTSRAVTAKTLVSTDETLFSTCRIVIVTAAFVDSPHLLCRPWAADSEETDQDKTKRHSCDANFLALSHCQCEGQSRSKSNTKNNKFKEMFPDYLSLNTGEVHTNTVPVLSIENK